MHRELSEVLSNEYSIVSDLGEDTLSMVSTVPSETAGEDKKSCACTFIFRGAFIGLFCQIRQFLILWKSLWCGPYVHVMVPKSEILANSEFWVY